MAIPSDTSSWVAETRFSGVIAELPLPRATARDLLPPELVLERGRGTARAYPMLTMFGEQTGSAVHLASMKVRTGVQFHEVLFGIRCVVERTKEPVLFIPLMYCDEPVSRWSGNALYGFNKRTASMEWLGRYFVVSGAEVGGEGLLLDMLVHDEGAPDTVTLSIGHLAHLLDRPVLGFRPDGSFARSMFHLDIGRARVQHADCRASLGVAALGTRTERLPLVVNANGCLRIEDARWLITWPEAWSIGEPLRGSSRVTRRHGFSQSVTSLGNDATHVDPGGLHGTT